MIDAPAPPTRHGRLLIVDDDEWIRRPFERILARDGHDVSTAVSAEEALQQMRSVKFDAIMLDLNMPLINGVGFLYRLRSQEGYEDVPVALVTGEHDLSAELMADLSALGARVVFKPVGAKELVNLARTLLDTTAPAR